MNVNYSSKEFEGQFTYFGNDLGCICTDSETRFRAWAPTAKQVAIRFYQSGVPAPDESYTEVPMHPDEFGTWVYSEERSLHGFFIHTTRYLRTMKQMLVTLTARQSA